MGITTAENMRKAMDMCREAHFEECHRLGRTAYFSAPIVYARLYEFVQRVIDEAADAAVAVQS